MKRLNIVLVGILASTLAGAPALGPFVVWLWSGWMVRRGYPEMTPEVGAIIGGYVTGFVVGGAQALDRWAKRQSGYVVGKYADQLPGEPPPKA